MLYNVPSSKFGGIDGHRQTSFDPATMCNLYSITRNQEAIRRLFRVGRDLTGNLPALPGVFPDTMAPVVRVAPDGERELSLMRWGFPPPPNLGKVPVTNVRNMASPYWRGWLKAQWRCLVPATSFCEWTDSRPKVIPRAANQDGCKPPQPILPNDEIFVSAPGLWPPPPACCAS